MRITRKFISRMKTHGLRHILLTPFRRTLNLAKLSRMEAVSRSADYARLDGCRIEGSKLDMFLPIIKNNLSGSCMGLQKYLKDYIVRNSNDATLAVADNAISGVFYIYGRKFDLGLDVDWCADIDGNGRWDSRYFRRYKFIGSNGANGDPRFTFELNRQQHLTLLAVAYCITGKTVYKECVLDHMTQWIQRNPVFYSVNWASAMEPALRLYSWGLTLALLAGNADIDTGKLGQILSSLYQQYRFVLDNLSRDVKQAGGSISLRNNHTIIELCGVLFVRYLVSGSELFEAGSDLSVLEVSLRAELERQTFADGMNVEQSTSYLRFVTEALMLTRLTAGGTMDKSVNRSIDYYYRSLDFFKIDDDRFILVGDEDNGHVVISSRSALPDDAGEVNSMRAALGGSDIENEGCGLTELHDSGHWIYRGNSTAGKLMVYMRAGPMDFPDLPGYAPHAHSDLLALCIYIDGLPVLVDTGTYSYHDHAWRNYFRKEQAHNTVSIVNLMQTDYTGLFGSTDHASSMIVEASEGYACGRLFYAKAGTDVSIIRELSVNRSSGDIDVVDTVESSNVCDVEWYLNTPLAAAVNNGIVLSDDNYQILIDGLPDPVVHREWYSASYGVKSEINRVVAGTGKIQGTVTYRWTIRPRRLTQGSV